MSAICETDGPEFERDWHQEDKDDRAQGLDRDDAEPPEEPPLDLNELEAQYGQAVKLYSFQLSEAPLLQKVMDRLPRLLAQLRADEAELEEWRALPYRDEYSVCWPGSPDCEGSRTWYPTAEKTLAVAEQTGGTPETQRFYTGPRVELQRPPF